MTFDELQNYIARSNIPQGVKLMSDSDWECNATTIDGAFYNERKNVIVLTQDDNEDDYTRNVDFINIKYIKKRKPECYIFNELVTYKSVLHYNSLLDTVRHVPLSQCRECEMSDCFFKDKKRKADD